MDNLLNKTAKLRQEKNNCLKENKGLARFFACFPLLIREIFISFYYLPHFLKKNAYSGFLKQTSRDPEGRFEISYSLYLRYKKFALSFLTVLLTLLGLSTSIFILNISPTKTLAAPLVCVSPYTVNENNPGSNQTLCADSGSFTFSGHWHDAGGVCANTQNYKAQWCFVEECLWLTIGAFGEINTGDVSYSGTATENMEGDHSVSWQDSIYASEDAYGDYYVRFGVQYGNTTWYYSGNRTVTVIDAPDVTGDTLTENGLSESSITWAWLNVSHETLYAVYDQNTVNKSGNLPANTTSWEEDSLSVNTQYQRKLYASGGCGATWSNLKSVYTSIESPTGISFDDVSQNSITVSGEGTISNLASGSSGIYYTESATTSNSGWLQTNSWEKSGLTANTQYTFDAKTRNGDSEENAAIAGESKYTLAADASLSGDETEGEWTNSTDITFTNDAGFGSGGVEYYRYVFDENDTHAFNDTEDQWNAGTQAGTATSESDWYMHVKAYNGDDVAGASGETQTLGPYKVDVTAPTINNNVTGDDAWINTGQNYDVDFLSNGGSPLDYGQYAVGSTQGGTDVLGWTDVFTEDTASYTSSWPVAFSSLSEGTNYVSFRTYDKAGNIKQVLDDGFLVKKDTVAATPSNVNISTSTDSATITWTTSEATTTQLAWGTTQALGNTTTEDTDLTTSHSVTIDGLNDDTTYYYDLLGGDRAGNETVYSSQAFTTSELEATVITNVKVTSLSPTSVKVTWTTNHAADSKVRYGPTTAYGKEKYDGIKVTSHSITLTGLTAGTTYHYEVISTGNTTTYDADATFTTEEESGEPGEPGGYLAAPTVISPADGSTVAESKPLITGLSRSNNTIFIFIDGELENTVLSTNHPSGTGSFAYRLRRNLENGEHTLYTIARNADNVYSNQSTTITFNIDLPFVTPHLYSPVFRDGENPTLLLRGVAYNNSTIKVYLDGTYLAEFTVTNNETYNTTSFIYEIPLASVSAGEHTVTVVAYDPNGRSSNTSDSVTFTKESITGRPDQVSYEFESGAKYRVVAGDSLWKLAERFYGNGADYTKIVQANREAYPGLSDNASLIQIGWCLTIP